MADALFIPVRLFVLLLALWAAQPAQAAGRLVEGEVSVSAVAQRPVAAPGDQFAIAVILDFEEGWHAWPNVPVLPKELEGLEATPTVIHADAAATDGAKATLKREINGVTIRADWTQYPSAAEVSAGAFGSEASILAYTGRAVAFVPVLVSPDAAPGERVIPVRVFFQACNDSTCLRATTLSVDVKITVAPAGTSVAPIPPEQAKVFEAMDPGVFAKILSGADAPKRAELGASFDFFGYRFTVADAAYGVIFLIAFAAGVLMNFTPCVLPVIPIKILSLQAQAKDPHRLVTYGLVYCAGIVALFVLIGVLAFAVGLNFGQWFSFWWFAVPLGVFIAIMGLGMIGAFSLRLPSWIYSVDAGHDSMFGNFKMGVLTGVLSTPCTGPMFGAAFAWATKQPPLIGLLAITTMGLGMAFPYLLLIIFPKLVDRLPRGGAAGELLKQVLGLFMVAVGIFIGVSSFGLRELFWGVGVVAGVACLWWAIGSFKYVHRPVARGFSVVGAVLAMAVTVVITLALTEPGWDTLKEQNDQTIKAEVAKIVKSGRPIVVDFTANWCSNCLTIEKFTLSTAEAKKLYSQYDARLLKVDFSSSSAGGWGVAREILGGGGSIPLIAIYGPATGPDKPVFFASFFKVSDLEAALKKATGK